VNFPLQHMSGERADVLAAFLRTRGRPNANSMHEWWDLSEDDREFWRSDIYRILAKANIHVIGETRQEAS
jgi:hypothetical protein